MNHFYFSAPGRVEISGNHTDHQHGCVLAAAIDMETCADVTLNGDGVIRVFSEGFAPCEISLDALSAVEDEKNTTAALVRGVAAAFAGCGCRLEGFDAHVRSTVLPGSGLSSSAAFEVLMGRIINGLFFENRLSPVEIARIGQYAENVYFGKPSGLMDQTASSVGGLVFIDFADPAAPAVERIPFDFSSCGYTICTVDSGADHADLTHEYAAIPSELKKLCAVFGKEYLRDVDESEFYDRIAYVRKAAGDRAVLRAMHIFDENRRVRAQAEALRRGDFDAFLRGVRESGLSSLLYLQNITPTGESVHQDMAFTLAICSKILNGKGAVRVHGGGFAGTALAFVPDEELESFEAQVNRVLGGGSCHVLHIV